MINIIRSIISFFGFNDAIVDGIGERGMRDSSIIRYAAMKAIHKELRLPAVDIHHLQSSSRQVVTLIV